MTRPNPHIALIYHYDLARALAGEVVDWQAIPVNVDAGREGGDLCRAAADFAKRRDLFAMPAPSNSDPPAPGTHESDLLDARYGPHNKQSTIEQSTVEIGGQVMTELQFNAARFALTAPDPGPVASPTDRDRLRARIADLITVYGERRMREHWPEDVPPLSKPGHTDDELAQILAAVRRVETEVGAAWHPDDGPPPHSRLAIERALKAWEGRDPGTAWFAASLIATFEQCRNADSTFEELVAQFTIEQANRLYDAAASQ